MRKSRFFILLSIFMLAFGTVSYARVCFLGGGKKDANGVMQNCLGTKMEEEFFHTDCPDAERCEAPKTGSKSCKEGGYDYYKYEDCCSNTDIYAPCLASEGRYCAGKKCEGKTSDGESFSSCENGTCLYEEKYSETCTGNKVGVGLACDGKYEKCECDRSKFVKCGANATGEGTSCTDDDGTWYTSCSCPAVTPKSINGNNWVATSSECCDEAYTETCTELPSGKEVYHCQTFTAPVGCSCGIKADNGCYKGCNDPSYAYIGSGVNVTCDDPDLYRTNEDGSLICGNECHCSTGFWDFMETCKVQDTDICSSLGYIDTACEGNYLACPFNATALACLEDVPTCEYYDSASCLSANPNSLCSKDSDDCWLPTTCKTNFTLSCNYSYELTGYDAYGCGKCTCPSGTYEIADIGCVDAYATCEDAGLVTPQPKEIEVCGEGPIYILSTSGATLKCYEERCSYYEYESKCVMRSDTPALGGISIGGSNTSTQKPYNATTKYIYQYILSSDTFTITNR